MKFTRLKITGFKSFVDTTVLDIKPGLTGLVGPNGCGKSNIVEAMKWNMGEAGPSRLRAGEMNDVIFSGTKGRPSRNSAEVILTIENNNEKLLQTYTNIDEIEVSRKIEKDEGSTYRINNKEVRQRDVQILYADIAIGSRSNAIVDQGQVGKIINSKAQERRQILEEAAGISGIHARKHETELKLKSTEVNLEKLEEIVTNDRMRLKELSRQSNQAKRYKIISENIRELDAIILYQRWNKNLINIERLKKELETFTENVNKVTRKISSKSLQQEKIENDLSPLREDAQKYANLLNKFKVEYDLLIKEEESLSLEQATQKENIKYLKMEILNEENLHKELDNQFKELDNVISKISSNNTNINLSQLNENLENAKKEEAYNSEVLTEAERVLSYNISQRDNLNNDISKLKLQNIDAVNNLKNTREELNNLNNISKDNDKKDIFYKDINILKKKLQEEDINEELIIKKIDLVKVEIKKFNEQTNEKKIVLQGKLRNIDQYNASKDILTKLFESDEKNIVINYLKFPKGFEKAIEASLGHGLKAALEKSSIEWRNIEQNTLNKLPEGIISLSEHAKGVPEVFNILKLTGLVENTVQGDLLQHKLMPGQQLVTKNGGLWRWDGYTHNEDAKTPANQILQNKTNLIDLNSKIKTSLLEADKCESIILNLNSKIELAEDNIREYNTRLLNINNNKIEIRNTIEQKQNALSTYIENHNENRTKLAILQSSKSKYKQLLETLSNDMKNYQNKEKSLISIEILKKNIALITIKNNEKKIELSNQISIYQKELSTIENKENQLTQLKNEQFRLNTQLTNIINRINKLKNNQNKAELNLKNLDFKPIKIEKSKIKILKEIDNLEENLTKTSNLLSESENTNKNITNDLRSYNEELILYRENRARQEGLLQQSHERQNDDKEIIYEKLNISPDKFNEIIDISKEFLDIEQSNLALEKLIIQRERIGPVNLVAEEDSEKLRIKLEEIEKEKEDLINAISKLRTSIRTINKEARSKLLEAFEEVNKYFKELFINLFGGGEAYLKLEGSDDPLESGLELMASPPGKKLQQMSLLSGGEQALTAMALIFSVFLTKPSPICVLDEVDAPLDESNVDRFLDLIDSISKKSGTRFLVVTHHRLTMARMDRLYGITMQEPGVSQLVSVSLKEAEKIKIA
ncbi:MAG: chromosome segregation protein SMC [Alphaproteobacteria bacterium]|jgi:chromosome segregation protein|nr:chromosome segregation protein SMC [Alphaproteobacteria bacterium]